MTQEKITNLSALTYYDSKLKTWVTEADAQVLKDAKAYADSLGSNYDAAGTAQTKVDELANGQVKENTDAIAAINDESTGILAQAKSYADNKDTAIAEAKKAGTDAQAAVDELETYVGTLPDGTSATSVVEYVNIKTAGIATDAALTELQNRLTGAQNAIDAIEEDYLQEADKTELQDQITANAGEIDAIKEDYLKEADKTELQTNIDAKADQSALDAEIARAKAAEEKNASDIALILDNPDTEDVDSIKEFISYIAEHGEVATGLQTQITANKDNLAAEVTRATEAENALDARLDVLEAIDHDAYKAADTALSESLTTEISKKADQSTVDAMDAAYKAADSDLSARLDDVEAALGSGEGSITEQIAAAKAEAIAEAVAKDAQVLSDAKAYTDEKVSAIDLSGIATNASEIASLKTRVSTNESDIASLKTAVNDTLPASIAEAKKAGTDAQASVDELASTVSTLSGKVTANESSISAHGDRLTALESKVGDGFVAITNAEVDALFA